MKKILFLSLFFLAGCSTTLLPPSKTIQNPKCEEILSLEVFQVLDKFVLANACVKNYDYLDWCKESFVVYIPKEKGKIYYDEQKIQFPDGKCPSFYDSYTYTTKQDFNKTVPKLKFINKDIPNPEYKKWEEQHNDK